VKEVADACKEFGVKLGIYCSPWDLNYPSEASDYPKAYRQQITELLGGNYGEIAEMWFDGNRADRIGEWDSLITLVRTLQPNIVIKQGPIVYPIREDVQWVGSEKALAPITNWNPYTPRRPSGAEPIWFPVECDFPLLTSGWFWSPGRRPKTLDTLTRIYFTSVGRGSVFMVNISPDRDGLVPDDQVKVLTDLNYKLKRYFSTDFAKGKNATATNIRGNDQTFGPAMALDGDKNTYWATDDEVTTATLEVDLGSQTRFNMVRMMEMISLGQRVAEYRVEALQSNGNWRRVTDGTTIGYKKLDRFPNVTASKVRLVIVESKACPTIKEFGVHDTASTATSVKENSAKNSVTPSDIALFQKYTGSFAPGAEIACRLPKESYVTLKVYAITGKHIATLVNGYRRAGFSTHRWNGLDLWGNRIAGGVYLACFKAGNITKTIMVNIRK
jgi:alpha-L-fucosidase